MIGLDKIDWKGCMLAASQLMREQMLTAGRTTPSAEDKQLELDTYAALIREARKRAGLEMNVEEEKVSKVLTVEEDKTVSVAEAREISLIAKRITEEIPAETDFTVAEIMLFADYVGKEVSPEWHSHTLVDGSWGKMPLSDFNTLRCKLERIAKFLKEQFKRLDTAATATSDTSTTTTPESTVVDNRKCMHGEPFKAPCEKCKAETQRLMSRAMGESVDLIG